MNYLSVENLTKSFGERVIFKDLTFGIDRGDKVAIVAKNGTGKSTLLKIVCGLDAADSGRGGFQNDIRVWIICSRQKILILKEQLLKKF
ncbi:MAG: ATP-binding cassette domain-containing protein [Crocinitomicaceae bacterium]|nr:ATP-binding cassette domain-containing protein [Crocinitomicaceae bacterium]